MTILDRYIARQYLINVVVLLTILFSFVVVIDVSLNFERFTRVAVQIGETESGEEPGFIRRTLLTVLVIVNLWWPRLLQLFNFLLGMVLVAAMGFTCSQLNRHREFLAMLAAGLGLGRVLRPIMIVAVALSFVQLLNQELVIPRVAPLLTRDHGDAGKVELGASEVPLTADGAGRVFRAASFDADDEVMTDVFILERDETGRPLRAISAERAVWRDGGWDLTGGIAEPRGRRDGSRATTQPLDRIETALGPTELKMNRFQSYRQAMSFFQIGSLLDQPGRDPQSRERLQRLRWGRFAIMIANLLTLMIAVPFYATREPTNMVVQSLKCAPIAILAIMGGVLGASAGVPGVPAGLGVFIPVMILTVVALARSSNIPT
ncbi:MAG: hypothetical protein DHS20C14_20170 [Phycisphaeraceae bacterium]|nr:MAG: hypothetical protein DHS20C14_20170 [Phycisphaeraceae bacterium]